MRTATCCSNASCRARRMLQERGIIKDDSVSVIAHATPADITGRDVIGVLPLALAALARSVTEIPLNLSPEMRARNWTWTRCAG